MRRARRVAVAVGLVMGILLTPGLGSHAVASARVSPHGSWSVVPAEGPATTSGALSSVSCSRSTVWCEAVGSFQQQQNGTSALAEWWNGTRWARQTARIPDARAGASGNLNGVSCVSATSCEAVGSDTTFAGRSGTYGFAEHWNGSAWTLQQTPRRGQNVLQSVSCASSIRCEAVGYVGWPYHVKGALAEAFDGTKWSLQPLPLPAESTKVDLVAVSCPTVESCEAVGSYFHKGSTLPLAERWNGRSWSLQPVPKSRSHRWSSLEGVSCLTSRSCEAVGEGGTNGRSVVVAERWNGTRWALQPAVDPPADSDALSSVSCQSGSDCEAAGRAVLRDGAGVPSAERWNGRQWLPQPVPVPPAHGVSRFTGISCTSSACEAVGTTEGSDTVLSLAAQWKGAWRLQEGENEESPDSATLVGVSCVSPSWCAAVGYYLKNGTDLSAPQEPLAELWNGKKWTLQFPPNPPWAYAAALSAVSCTSATFCEAVGSAEGRVSNTTRPLTEMWNGTTWTTEVQPNGDRSFTYYLDGISCTAPTFCEAVGIQNKGTEIHAGGALAETWNGSSWAFSSPVSPKKWKLSVLGSISCVSASDCEAVGRSETVSATTTTEAPLVERWDGSEWSLQPAPAVRNSLPLAQSVSCVSGSSCQAAGALYADSGETVGTLAESWNGSRWSVERAPEPKGARSGLAGISCLPQSFCESTGTFWTAHSDETPLAEGWNGSQWVIQNWPRWALSENRILWSVSCSTTTACVAVGESDGNSNQSILTARFASG